MIINKPMGYQNNPSNPSKVNHKPNHNKEERPLNICIPNQIKI